MMDLPKSSSLWVREDVWSSQSAAVVMMGVSMSVGVVVRVVTGTFDLTQGTVIDQEDKVSSAG